MIEVILVSTGSLQEYIVDNIKHLTGLGYKKITVITEKEYFPKLSECQANLVDSRSLNLDGRFDANNNPAMKDSWKYLQHVASKRLFLLYKYLKNNNKTNCIHIENDTLLYNKFTKSDFNSEKAYITMDSGNRCIPGFIYIPSWELLDDLINNWGKGNDMQNMAGYFKRNRSTVEPLPIIKPNLNYNFDDHKDPNYRIVYKNHALFNGIFDAAAIGQYLGGTHRGRGNDIGFVNETCLVKYNCYDFIWKRHAPYIIIDNQEVPIYNLHIHSKNLKKFINGK